MDPRFIYTKLTFHIHQGISNYFKDKLPMEDYQLLLEDGTGNYQDVFFILSDQLWF